MKHCVHFRSHIEGKHPSESSSQRVCGQGSEVKSIRPYVTGDDPRNIAWNKGAGTGGLYVKERENTIHAPVVFISLLGEQYSDFHTASYPVSKNDFLSALTRNLDESALHLRFPLEMIDSYTEHRKDIQRYNSIILILGDLENRGNSTAYLHLARDNDVIFLSLSHPVELDPYEGENLFDSQYTTRAYTEALRSILQAQEKIFYDHGIAVIHCTTHDHPVELLNHFFKYRYARS